MTGNNYFLVLGPVVIGALIVCWIALTLYANFRRRRYGPSPRSDVDEQEVHTKPDDHGPVLDHRSTVTPGIPLIRRKD